MGLPIRKDGPPYRHLQHGSAEVVFLKISADTRFLPLGVLQAKSAFVNDQCKVSCVDWYGNARPIFFRNRIFALMGYELVEGKLVQDKLNEQKRLTYFIKSQKPHLVKQTFLFEN